MSDPRQGEIYYWPDINENHPMGDGKIHRWVVVSRDAFNELSDHVLACPLTSHRASEIDVLIKPTPKNQLEHESSLLAKMITPISKDNLGESKGRLLPRETGQILDRLRIIIEVS